MQDKDDTYGTTNLGHSFATNFATNTVSFSYLELRIHKDTERGDNESIKYAGSGTAGAGCGCK